ncbi:energy transducer TonB [Teredinibacter turnerae]|uniref:TonB domain protein n=1 Tax=Teredinibacter turnerae (strain ATCC 39867 / T7901) TaxID=377629 RepID=C5BMA9_TERTT|nr:energy transducer TonB [Teredinibacter turnerae]ACR12525.1 TonB domain protein [Teredinibacter turnerae T7901]
MSIVRLLSSLAPAALVTLGLLLLMHVLILRNMTEPEESKEFKIPEILMPEREITTEYDTSRPEKPQEPEEPPPELPEPEFDNPDVQMDISFAPQINTGGVQISGIGGFSSDGDYLPIVKVAPKYPARAANRGLEGYCTVEYTVTKTGETRDISVVDCPDSVFASASVKAAEKFKYKPKVIDGEPIEVPGVRNRFTFQMAKDK